MKHKTITRRAAFLGLCVALPVCAAPNKIVQRRDEPLQTTWYVHSRPPYAKNHERLFHADTYAWQCYPAIGQNFRLDKKWLLLTIRMEGPDNFSFADLVISVDGAIVNLPGLNWKQMTLLCGMPVAERTLLTQDTLVAQIASAKEVWLTILPGGASYAVTRHSIKLLESQIQCFREITKVYTKLDPK